MKPEEERAPESMQEANESSPVPPHENVENGPPGATPSPRSVFKRPEMAEKRNRYLIVSLYQWVNQLNVFNISGLGWKMRGNR